VRTPPISTAPTESPPAAARLDSVLCSGAAARLIWAIGALALLWTTVLWALD